MSQVQTKDLPKRMPKIQGLYVLCISPSKSHQNEVGRSDSDRTNAFRSI